MHIIFSQALPGEPRFQYLPKSIATPTVTQREEHCDTKEIGESLRGNRIGATGLRASERKSASERVSERGL